jgi:putative DNA primase/helicase
VPFRAKGPQLRGWQTLRISAEQVTHYFRDPTNIGVILGAASGGLVDIDIDCAEALALADSVLPVTRSIFGRPSKPRAHRIYRVAGLAPSLKFSDPITGEMLVELRGDKQDGSPGMQTIFPGSVHPTGEMIEFDEDGEPSLVEYETLKQQAAIIAGRSLMTRYYPGAVSREQIAAALEEGDPRIKARIQEWSSRSQTRSQSTQPEQTPRVSPAMRANAGEPWSERSEARLRDALQYLPAEADEHFLHRAMEIKWLGWKRGWAIFRDWAKTTTRGNYNERENRKRWDSLKSDHKNPRTIASLFHEAKQRGWDEATLNRDGCERGEGPATSESSCDERVLIDELASLNTIAYEKRRYEAAKQLGIRVTSLDKAVARRCDELEEAQETQLFEHWAVEPWPEPVDGDALVLALIHRIRSHVVMTAEAALTVALWIMFAWVHAKIAIHSPILMITSPEAECGKTTLLNLIGFLVPRSLSSVGISPAALYRSIEKWEPTLIVDEADVAFVQNEDLRAVVNSGWTRGQGVLRCVGDDNEPTFFPTFCPKAIGLKGKKLPDTTASRAIVVELKRKLADDNVADFRHVDDPGLKELRQQLMRWTSDNIEALGNASPSLPHGFVNRVAANWHLLLAIAETAGGEWPEKAHEAAAAIAKVKATLDASIGIQLLGAIRDVLGDEMDCIFSKNLIAVLIDDPEKPWAEYRRGKPLTQKQLANRLREFGITPETVWIGQESAKGYKRTAFEDTWRRYLSE